MQSVIDTEWTKDRVEENVTINRIRFQVGRWRTGGRGGVTQVTRRLLDYWTDGAREKRLFFCQIEALETAIYITEVARKDNAGWIEEELRRYNDDSNPGLYRMALKMATGSGKTVVMAMMIAWQTLNKLANPQDRRFADAFLVVAPGITIRDRLRVLLPNNPNTIAYVNSAMSRARFYAVELVKFSGKDVSAFETRTVWRPAVAGIRDGQDKVDEETFLAGVDDPVYRESLRESLEFCRGLGLRFPWGPAGTSIRIQTIDKAERVSIGWLPLKGLTGRA